MRVNQVIRLSSSDEKIDIIHDYLIVFTWVYLCQIRDGISQRTFSWGKLFLKRKREGNFLIGNFSARLRAPLSVLHQTFLKESRRMRAITKPIETAWRVSPLQHFKTEIFSWWFRAYPSNTAKRSYDFRNLLFETIWIRWWMEYSKANTSDYERKTSFCYKMKKTRAFASTPS